MKRYNLRHDQIYQGDLILVNALHPYKEPSPEETLLPVCPGEKDILMEQRAARTLAALMDGIDGWEQIAAVSGWRSGKEQEELYAQSLLENGSDYTRRFVALPGCSEHQTGLAIDLGLRQENIDFICPDFPYTGICRTFRERAASHGFTERYPRGKETVTGIGREPWHFRYVGRPHALVMEEMGFVLEEYIDFLRAYPFGGKPFIYRAEEGIAEVSFLKAGESGYTAFEAEEGISVSGNNVDGFILTGRRTR